MKLFLGIDGGGTHTRALLSDETGRIVGRAQAGLSNPGHASDAELLEQFSAIFSELKQAGHNLEECVSAFGGIAGVTAESSANRLRGVLVKAGLANATIGIDHDIRIALAGGLGGRPGIALIVGTGSSCYGRNAKGQTCQTGGWGALVADEGSGYYLAREAMVASVRMADGRVPPSPLLDAMFAFLNIKDISEILKRLYEDGISRTEIAAFAPEVVRQAELGDRVCLEILSRGADELAQMAGANHWRLPTGMGPDIVITGGLGTAKSVYRDKLHQAIRGRLPNAVIHDLFMPPEAGAVMLALEQVNGSVSSEVLQNLRTTAA